MGLASVEQNCAVSWHIRILLWRLGLKFAWLGCYAYIFHVGLRAIFTIQLWIVNLDVTQIGKVGFFFGKQSVQTPDVQRCIFGSIICPKFSCVAWLLTTTLSVPSSMAAIQTSSPAFLRRKLLNSWVRKNPKARVPWNRAVRLTSKRSATPSVKVGHCEACISDRFSLVVTEGWYAHHGVEGWSSL